MSNAEDHGAGTAGRDARTPWLPAGLVDHGFDQHAVQALSYLVVEEILDDVVIVTVSSWPAADRWGRLRFDLESVDEFAVALAALRSQFYQGWLARDPRVGDVFGAEIAHEHLRRHGPEGGRHELDELLPGPVYDLSVEARRVAKLAYYAAVTETISAEAAHRYGMDERAERGDPIPVRSRVGFSSGEEGP